MFKTFFSVLAENRCKDIPDVMWGISHFPMQQSSLIVWVHSKQKSGHGMFPWHHVVHTDLLPFQNELLNMFIAACYIVSANMIRDSEDQCCCFVRHSIFLNFILGQLHVYVGLYKNTDTAHGFSVTETHSGIKKLCYLTHSVGLVWGGYISLFSRQYYHLNAQRTNAVTEVNVMFYSKMHFVVQHVTKSRMPHQCLTCQTISWLVPAHRMQT